MNVQTTKQPRLESVDALRGFAVMAILLLHNIEHFIFPLYPENQPTWLADIDKATLDLGFALFGGKAYAIFSLLFGFTFYIQSANSERNGVDFGPRFLWRIVLLFGFATLNAALFPGGDVLILYAVVAIVLFFMRKQSNRVVLAVALFFLFQPWEWAQCLYAAFCPEYTAPNYSVGALYDEVARVGKEGSLWDFFLCNITTGQLATLAWSMSAGRVSQTAGLFLMGFYLGRKQLFLSTDENRSKWITALICSAIAYVPLYTIHSLLADGTTTSAKMAAVAFDMWHKLAFMVVMTSSFLLLYQRAGFANKVSALRTYGRMSLTNYVSQSYIGAVIYFPFFLGLGAYLGHTLSVVMGGLIFLLQVKFCNWYLSNHKQGPLEGLWHKWTWIKK